MEKITINQQYANIKAFLEENGAPIGYITFIEDRMAQVKRKNASRSNKPTKSATETASVAEKILAVLPAEGKFTATEIAGLDEGLKGTSNQRMTAALKVLINTGFVVNTKEKGKSYFSKA